MLLVFQDIDNKNKWINKSIKHIFCFLFEPILSFRNSTKLGERNERLIKFFPHSIHLCVKLTSLRRLNEQCCYFYQSCKTSLLSPCFLLPPFTICLFTLPIIASVRLPLCKWSTSLDIFPINPSLAISVHHHHNQFQDVIIFSSQNHIKPSHVSPGSKSPFHGLQSRPRHAPPVTRSSGPHRCRLASPCTTFTHPCPSFFPSLQDWNPKLV